MRFSLFLLLLSLLQIHAQTPPPSGNVLKALPIEFEEPSEIAPVGIESPNEAPAPASSLETQVISPIDQKPKGEDAIRLQIFLDEAQFGPGIIDGKIGQFTELAVRCWNEVNGEPIDSWTAVNTAARKATPNPYATAIVPEICTEWVDTKLTFERSEQGKVKRMSYRSVAEFMSERYHTTVPYLIELNSKSKIDALKPRDTLRVPNVSAFRIEDLKGLAFPKDELLSQRHAVVDTKLNQVRIYQGVLRALIVRESDSAARTANHSLIAAFPITPGKPEFIRYGKWTMQSAVELPIWRYDQKLLDTGIRSEKAVHIAGGPNNPVGILWCGLSRPGIGMHGTSDPETIGRSRSAGCIRLANWDIVRIPALLRPGASVEIR